MRSNSDHTDNNALLHYRNYHPRNKETVYSFVEIIGNNKPIDSQEDIFYAANSVANILAFLEYGLSDHVNEPPIPLEVIHDGLSEIVRACRLVTRRIEDYAFVEHDKSLFPDAYANETAKEKEEGEKRNKKISILNQKPSTPQG